MNDGCKGSEKISYQQEIIHKIFVMGLQNVTFSHFLCKKFGELEKM